MITKFLQWLILSSKDSNKISLTIKAIAAMIVPIVIALSGITADQANSVVDQIQLIVQNGLFIITAAVAIWGAIRKIITTFAGRNEVVIAQQRGEFE